jgi:hypothetical protein
MYQILFGGVEDSSQVGLSDLASLPSDRLGLLLHVPVSSHRQHRYIEGHQH